jgi:hypothetical protein
MAQPRTEYYEFESASGPIVFETRVERGGAVPVSAGAVVRTGQAIETLLAQVGEIVGPLYQGISAKLADASEISMEFGVKVGGKAGIIVAATEIEGNFKVSVKWQRTKAP